MLCPNCQKPLSEGAHYCSECGQKIGPQNSKKRPFAKTFLPLLALLALLGGGWYLYNSTGVSFSFPVKPEDSKESNSSTERLLEPPQAFMQALKENNLKKAYEDYSSKGFRENTSYANFQDFVKDIPLLSHFSEVLVKSHEINQGRGLVTLLLNPDQENLPVEFRLIQDNGPWKILFLRVIYPHETKATGGKLDALSIISTVQEYLEALQSKKIGQAYKKFLSSDLQKEVPLDGFAQFINGYPAFTDHDSINIKEPSFEEDMGQVTIELQKGEQITEITYALKEENREWKIIGMHVEKIANAASEIHQNGSSFKTRDLIDAIQVFLKTLREQKVDEAYSQLTANHFREENTLADFEDFLKKYPHLSDSESATFEKLMFNNNIATFSVDLFLNETEALPVEFDLMQEQGKWKILNLFVHPVKKIDPKQKNKAPEIEIPLEFTKVQLGTKIDANGEIADPRTTFPTGKEDIYVNLFVHNGQAGKSVEVVMRHVESGSSIPPVQATILEDGDSTISLVFSPPPKGWPAGNYQLRVATDNKVYKTFVFKVE